MDTDGKPGKTPEPLKAFRNPGFLQSKDARLIRMLSEYLEPASRLKWQRVRDTIVSSVRREPSRLKRVRQAWTPSGSH